jgi:mannitol/fructose-specific phosphotransferase system IIA component (Ntr-type)
LRLVELIEKDGIVRLGSADAEGVIAELAIALGRVHGVDPEKAREALSERERLGSTGLGRGIAVPHARAALSRTVGVLGISKAGVPFGAADGEPVQVFVALLSPEQGGDHLKCLAAAARELAHAHLRSRLIEAESAEAAHAVLGGAS